jgi:hypothetical protein
MAPLVSLAFFLVYLLTTNQIFSFDAVTNAIACERGGWLALFHSNHLLYPFIGALWFKLERLFSYDGYAIYSLARFNSFMVAVGLGIIYQALTKRLPRLRAAIATAILGSTYAVWHYAVDGRAVGITVFFSSLLILFLVNMTEHDTVDVRHAFLGSALSSLYVFSHAIAIFHVLPVAWYFFKRAGKRVALIYVADTLSTIAAVHIAVYIVLGLPPSPQHFLSWILGYAGQQNGAAQALNSPFWAANVRQIVMGLWHGWANAFLMPATSLGRPAMFFARALAALYLVGLAIAGRRIKRRPQNEQFLFWTLALWGAVITVFLAFWSPGQEGFRLHVLVPWTAALFLGLSDIKGVFQGAALSAALLFSLNLSGPIYHNASIKNNAGYQLLSELQSHLKPGDLVVAGSAGSIPDYEVLRPYFFPKIAGGTLFGWLLVNDQTNFDALKSDFDRKLKDGRTLYWLGDMFDPALQTTLEKSRPIEPGAVDKLIHSFGTKTAFELSNGVTVYEVVKSNH